ncbi:MAG: phospholipid carrier-dependent glycosyltransferase [Clostridiales bacterium]|nr:phospholipid carrier-dependent glycosyltransferase [Clostridiales bacterium]
MKRRNLQWLLIGLLCVAAVLAALLWPKGTDAVYDTQLLSNGDFERVTAEGIPESWLPDAYNRIPGVSEFDVVPGRSGNGIRVRNAEHNDARYLQTLTVSPNTVYELSGYVKANVADGRGASLSIADVYVVNESVLDTGGEWQHIVVYGRTASDQHELTVYARVGGYSADSQGEAVFDDISLKALRSAPPGAVVDSWQIWKGTPQADEGNIKSPAAAWPWLVLLGVAWLLLARRWAMRAQAEALQQEGMALWNHRLLWLLVIAMASRLLLAVLVPGYDVDIGCFTGWANRMHAVGPAEFYLTEQHTDYPPGYMLVLWPLGLMGSWLGTGATGLMVKLPALAADLAAIVLLYRFAARRTNPRTGLFLAAIYAFSPLVYVTGAAWGQVDSVPAALLLAVLLLAFEGRWAAALPLYVLSALMKPQALMFGPLGLAALVLYLVRSQDKRRWRQLWVGVGISLAVAAAVVLPFSFKQDGFDWLIKLYSGTMTFYGYATVNATNLYFLFGLNWQPVGAAAPWLLRLLGPLTLVVPTAVYLWPRAKGTELPQAYAAKAERVVLGLSLLPALAVAAIPMSLSLTGTLLMVSGFMLVLARFIAARDVYNLPLLGGVLLLLFCALGVMMHERYLYPAALLLVVAYVIRRDRRILWLALAVSVLTYLNVGVALDRAIRIGGVPGHLEAPLFGIGSDSAWLEYLLSALNVLVCAAGLYIGLTQSRADRAAWALPALDLGQADVQGVARGHQAASRRLLHPEKRARMDGKDWLIVAVVTVLYGVLALTNLGSTTAPQHPWITSTEDSEVIFDLGEQRSINLLYYPGQHQRESHFDVAVSADGERWQTHTALIYQGSLFQWHYLADTTYNQKNELIYTGPPLALEGRYVRITAPVSHTTLMEVVLRDAQTKERIQPVPLSGPVAALLDEQDTLQGEPTWFNSMYFDEIYHARTAYEHLNAMRGLEPSATYETSHPPLGKVLMSFSVMIFGMTPFGWRFAGALAGVLMLPGLYLMGKLLTRRRLLAALAMLLLAFDTMHFAQTRIATIDSFVTLFIIWSYYFMFRYALDEEGFAGGQGRDLVNLGLSGLFMGLGIASKWTGFYAGAGLAVIFFWALWRRAQQGIAARALIDSEADIPHDRMAAVQASAWHWPWRALRTLLSCVLFFIAVPAVIYYVSFLPWFMRTPGGLTVKKVFDVSFGATGSMLSYHSDPGLGMDHPFYSPWYQWPLSIKPLWFHAGKRLNGTGSSIFTFGNLAVWWGGFASMLVLAVRWLGQRVRLDHVPLLRGLNTQAGDMRPGLLMLSYLAQYLPWMLVPRGTYIYHYFPSVPFIVLGAAVALGYLWERRERLARRLTIGYLVLAMLFFIAFFPYASGLRVPDWWLSAMQWFPNWLYF